MDSFAFWKVRLTAIDAPRSEDFVASLNVALDEELSASAIQNAELPWFELRDSGVTTGRLRLEGDSWDAAEYLRITRALSSRFPEIRFSLTDSNGEVLTAHNGSFGDADAEVSRFIAEYATRDGEAPEHPRPARGDFTCIEFSATLQEGVDEHDDPSGELPSLASLEKRIEESISSIDNDLFELSLERDPTTLRGRLSWKPQSGLFETLFSRIMQPSTFYPANFRVRLTGEREQRDLEFRSEMDWIAFHQELMVSAL